MLTGSAKIALVALVCLVLVHESLAGDDFEDFDFEGFEASDPVTEVTVFAYPDDAETEFLTGSAKKFSSYCIAMRDSIRLTQAIEKNKLASRVFLDYASAARGLSQDDIRLYEEAASILASEGDMLKSENKIVHAINEAGSGKSAFDKFLIALEFVTFPEADQLKGELRALINICKTPEQRTRALNIGCDMVERVKQNIVKQFETAKASVMADDSSVAGLSAEDVPCRATSSVLKSVTFCKLVNQLNNVTA